MIRRERYALAEGFVGGGKGGGKEKIEGATRTSGIHVSGRRIQKK